MSILQRTLEVSEASVVRLGTENFDACFLAQAYCVEQGETQVLIKNAYSAFLSTSLLQEQKLPAAKMLCHYRTVLATTIIRPTVMRRGCRLHPA